MCRTLPHHPLPTPTRSIGPSFKTATCQLTHVELIIYVTKETPAPFKGYPYINFNIDIKYSLLSWVFLILILIMNTKSDIKKVGRPKGREKVGYYRRVTPVEKERIEEFLERIRKGGHDGALASGELVKLTAGIKGGREPGKAVAKPVITSNAKEVAALLDDIQGLTDKVGALEVELEECRNLTYDEKMEYWKVRALKAEAYAASKNE